MVASRRRGYHRGHPVAAPAVFYCVTVSVPTISGWIESW